MERRLLRQYTWRADSVVRQLTDLASAACPPAWERAADAKTGARATL
jgi:hypothetical protein